MLEMKETAFICKNATSRSLILLDELGRATSNEDGVAIAWAVAESLLATGALTYFVTHYPQLCQMSRVYPAVQNQHLKSSIDDDENGGIKYTHKIGAGPCDVTSSYGVDMAVSCGWPSDVVQEVRFGLLEFDLSCILIVYMCALTLDLVSTLGRRVVSKILSRISWLNLRSAAKVQTSIKRSDTRRH